MFFDGNETQQNDGSATTEAPAQQITDPTPTPETNKTSETTATPTAAPTPATSDNAAEAIRIAEQNGLTEEDLHGQYDLFLQFHEKIQCSGGIGKYKGVVYKTFPVFAANIQYFDTDYFLERVGTLTFFDLDYDIGDAGLYYSGSNHIEINTQLAADYYHLPAVVFHELMHFLDYSAGRDDDAFVLFNDKTITYDEFLALSSADQEKAKVCFETDYVTEGGAELYTAKHFSKAVRAYFIPCQFLTGLEYIYGTETLNKIFFGVDSRAEMAKLFLDAGYSWDKYCDANASLNYVTYPERHGRPDNYIMPEDILIDLYEAKIGAAWKDDAYFCYILKCMNTIGGFEYKDSPRASQLKDIEFASWGQYETFIGKLYSGLSEVPDLRYAPPSPLILDERKTIGAFAIWKDPETKEMVRGTISTEYDFSAERVTGYDMTDMEKLMGELLTERPEMGVGQ